MTDEKRMKRVLELEEKIRGIQSRCRIIGGKKYLSQSAKKQMIIYNKAIQKHRKALGDA